MNDPKDQHNKFIAWNGVSLRIPAAWDLRVSGLCHLVFEKDFEPQLQIRWEKPSRKNPQYLQNKLTGFNGQSTSIIPHADLPAKWQKLKEKFGWVNTYREAGGTIEGGICSCKSCNTVLLFQLLSRAPALPEEVGDCLESLSCHGHQETLWRVQDFSLITPPTFKLKDYTFGAGLTRLSFFSGVLFLQTCKLAPADTRLSQQSLEEILLALTGTSVMEVHNDEDKQYCEGYRSPSIAKQIVFRLRREKPFLLAKIWHDRVSNRLLAVVLSSKRPIPQTTAESLYKHYEIVQEENRT